MERLKRWFGSLRYLLYEELLRMNEDDFVKVYGDWNEEEGVSQSVVNHGETTIEIFQ